MKKIALLALIVLSPPPLPAQEERQTEDGQKYRIIGHIDEGRRENGRKKGDKKSFSSPPKKGLRDYSKKSFNLYSKQDDIALGSHYMTLQTRTFERKGVKVDSPRHAALKKRIEGIVARLAAVSDEPSFPYEVHIFDKPDVVNAFCMPGGKIGVFTGLFDSKKGLVDEKNDAQIAAVLSHEIAHATLRHVTRMVSTYQGVGFLGTLASLGIGQGVGEQAQGIFNQIFNLGGNLYFPSYSRKYEKAADQAGLYYMSKAGYNPGAAVDIWKKAAARGGPNSKKTDFFASHPAGGERAKALEAWLPEAMEIYRNRR